MTPPFSQLERKHPKGSWEGKLLITGETELNVRIQVLPCVEGRGGEEGSGVWPLMPDGFGVAPAHEGPAGLPSCPSLLTAPRLGKLFIELEACWRAASGTN